MTKQVARTFNFAEYSEVLAKKQAAYAQYRETRDSMRELLTVKANIDMVTDRHAPARNTIVAEFLQKEQRCHVLLPYSIDKRFRKLYPRETKSFSVIFDTFASVAPHLPGLNTNPTGAA